MYATCDAGAATPFAASTNDTIDATNHAYWTPADGANGLDIAAFTVKAKDDDAALSATAVTVNVDVTAAANVWFGRPLGFVVTPKTRQARQPFPWRLIWPQLTAMAVLVLACVVGGLRLWAGTTTSVIGTGVNWLWVAYDLLVLSVIIEAARFRQPEFPDQVEERAA